MSEDDIEKARMKLKSYKQKLEMSKQNSMPLKTILYYEKKVDKWMKIFHKLNKSENFLPPHLKNNKNKIYNHG